MVAAENFSMDIGLVDPATAEVGAAFVTTESPCIVCVMSCPLDDERPAPGTVRWQLHRTGRLQRGVAVRFECPCGHNSDQDPALLKGFRPRVFPSVRQ